jgi:hypothetical protein
MNQTITTIQIVTPCGTGDADLYIRCNTQSTTSNWDCRPYLNGNNESVTVSGPQEGTWYISVRAYMPLVV